MSLVVTTVTARSQSQTLFIFGNAFLQRRKRRMRRRMKRMMRMKMMMKRMMRMKMMRRRRQA